MVKIATVYLYDEIDKKDIDILNLYQTGNDEFTVRFTVRLTEKTRNKYVSGYRLSTISMVEDRTFTLNELLTLIKGKKVTTIVQYELTNLWS